MCFKPSWNSDPIFLLSIFSTKMFYSDLIMQKKKKVVFSIKPKASLACLLPTPTHSPKVKFKHSMYKIVPCARGTPTVVGTKCDMGPFVIE